MAMEELVFEVLQELDGGFSAECLTENIFTEGDSWKTFVVTFEKLSMLSTSTQSHPGQFACIWFAMKCCQLREDPSRCLGATACNCALPGLAIRKSPSGW